MEVRFGAGFLLATSEVVVVVVAGTTASWLDRFEFDVLGSAEIAREGYGEEVEHDAASWSSFFSSSWNGKF